MRDAARLHTCGTTSIPPARTATGRAGPPVHVELVPAGTGVAEPHRAGPLVAREPGRLGLPQQALPRDPVGALQPGRVAGHRPHQPAEPGGGLLVEAAAQQARQDVAGVAQPAEPLVPVEVAADQAGQGRGGGGHDAAGRCVGERLQRDQRAHDRFAPGPLVAAPARPPAPEVAGLLQRRLGGHGERGRCAGVVGRRPDDGEGEPVAGGDGEVGQRRSGGPAAGHRAVGAEPDGVRAGDGQAAPVTAAQPGHDPPLVEPQPEFAVQRDPSASPSTRRTTHGCCLRGGMKSVTRTRPEPVRHSVSRTRLSGGRTCGRTRRPCRAGPGARIRCRRCQEGGETRRRVEAGQTQPVQRPVPADQRGGSQVAQEGVVLNRVAHDRHYAAVHITARRFYGGTAAAATGRGGRRPPAGGRLRACRGCYPAPTGGARRAPSASPGEGAIP